MITSLSIGRGGLGRFGNQAFTIASTIGIAIKSWQQYGFPHWKTHDNALFGQPVDDIEAELLNPLPRIPDDINWQDYPYFWGYKEVYLPNGNWSIDAHMQSDKFFNHCLPLIRKTFTFKDEPPQNDYVAVHVRCGDYISEDNAHHPICNWEYYSNAFGVFPTGTKFKLFSDDLHHAYAIVQTLAAKFYIDVSEEINYIDDFKLMKSCKHFITANSSFSLMAAILGNHPEKKIICPRRWFGKSMPATFDTKDIYPEGAIIL